jgi:hypothetical protein
MMAMRSLPNTYEIPLCQPAGADALHRGAPLGWALKPVEIGHLWSWEEEESFTLEICIEGYRLL